MSEHGDDDSNSGEHARSVEPPSNEPHRRGFLALTVAGSCAIGATVAVPAAMFVADPLARRGEAGKRFLVAKLEELEPGVPKRATVVGDEVDAWTRAKDRRLGSVWLVRTGAREVRALSTICPHLGCGVDASPDGKGFGCPCHTSDFDLTGKVIGGPSPRGLDELPVEIGPKGEVFVTWKRFRIGDRQREEIA